MGTKQLRSAGPHMTEMPLLGFKRDDEGYYRLITRCSTKEVIGGKVTRGKEEVSEQRYEMGTAEDYLYKFDVIVPWTKEEKTVYFRKVPDETS